MVLLFLRKLRRRFSNLDPNQTFHLKLVGNGITIFSAKNQLACHGEAVMENRTGSGFFFETQIQKYKT